MGAVGPRERVAEVSITLTANLALVLRTGAAESFRFTQRLCGRAGAVKQTSLLPTIIACALANLDHHAPHDLSGQNAFNLFGELLQADFGH